MSEIEIGPNAYQVYQTVDEITVYADGQIGTSGDGWRAADPDDLPRAAISSTRLLDRLVWDGAPTDDYQPLAWPRTGLLDANGVALDPTVIPQAVLDANSEIATALAAGLQIQPDPNAPETQLLKAGSVTIQYFRTIEGTLLPLPLAVMQLIGLWLGSRVAFASSISTGTHERTSFDREYRPIQPF